MTKNIFTILVATLAGISAIAQEVLTMPAYNAVVANQYQTKRAFAGSTAVTLPFYDDFSVVSVYPSSDRWADTYAFINTDFAKFPPSIGVATLDALDASGALYPNAGPNPFDADYLTSLPIRLDSVFSPVKKAISPADSIYLSFYYQPQGRAVSPPSKKAFLLLEFHSPGDNDTISTASDTIIEPRWKEIWSTTGGTAIDTFAMPGNHYFRQVLIPIKDTSYLKNGFQFRFRNIATLAGNSQPDWRNNGSNWNIDAVWLDIERGINETTLPDIAFGDIAPSMLRNYESMPFRQYRNNFINEMKENLNISISNLDYQVQNVSSYKYEVRKNSGNPIPEYNYNGGTYNVEPFITNGYSTWAPYAKPPVTFFFPPSNEEKVVFHIIHTLTPEDVCQTNNTIQFDQLFSNYYAYDNGTSEAGVGINGATGSYAVQFRLNVADTLRGIQIYFNRVIGGTNQKLIDLNVWNDAFGKPGQIINSISGVTPVYSGSLNEFNTYWFENPVVIGPGTFPGMIFYIGWSQTFVNNLNVGFDRYKDSHSRRFYNVDGTWAGSDSINYGSLMMRPIIGPVNPLAVALPVEVRNLIISPNPVTDGNLVIQLPEYMNNSPENNLNISMYSASGSLVLNEIFSNPINVRSLKPGFYMILLVDRSSGRKSTGKLIIR